KPDSLRTNCNAEARISSSLAGGSKLNSGLMLRHMARTPAGPFRLIAATSPRASRFRPQPSAALPRDVLRLALPLRRGEILELALVHGLVHFPRGALERLHRLLSALGGKRCAGGFLLRF